MQHKLAQPQNKSYNRLKAQLNKRQEKVDKTLTTQSGQSPFFSKGTGYKALLALQNPRKPQDGEIILFNATDTQRQCYNWEILNDGLALVIDSFNAGACNLTAVDAGNLTRTGDNAFTGYIPLAPYRKGEVRIKEAGQFHSGYQSVMATTAGASFAAELLACADEVLRTGVEPFIKSTDDYAGCDKPAEVRLAMILFGTAVGVVAFGYLFIRLMESRCKMDPCFTSIPATTVQEPEPRSSWCCFLRRRRDTPVTASYVALDEVLNSAPGHFEIDSGQSSSL